MNSKLKSKLNLRTSTLRRLDASALQGAFGGLSLRNCTIGSDRFCSDATVCECTGSAHCGDSGAL